MGIVERLRSGHVRYGIESEQDAAKRWIKERREAADEIERLREALQKIAAIEDEHINAPKNPETANLWVILAMCIELAEKALKNG